MYFVKNTRMQTDTVNDFAMTMKVTMMRTVKMETRAMMTMNMITNVTRTTSLNPKSTPITWMRI